MEYLYALLGFVLLIGSGKYLVRGSVSLAQHFKISSLVIGVTVVAFGTSAPELLVSVQAALKGHPEMSMGNVIGSNISNIGLVLAVSAIILPLQIHRNSIRIDWPVMMGVSLLFWVFIRNLRLSRAEGIILISLLAAYIVFSIRMSGKRAGPHDIFHPSPTMGMPVTLILIIVSCAGLIAGSHLLIVNAVVIARDFGISERVISITMLAVGTSMPELATSVMAAVQKEPDISVGNVLGSNIFNILSVLGITAMIKPIGISAAMAGMDVLWMIGISFLLFLLFLPLKNPRLGRTGALVLLLVYVFYIYLVIDMG